MRALTVNPCCTYRSGKCILFYTQHSDDLFTPEKSPFVIPGTPYNQAYYESGIMSPEYSELLLF